MKKMRRLISLLLVFVMILGLAACGSSSTSTDDDSDDVVDEETETSTDSSETVDTSDLDTASAETTEDGEPVYGGSLTIYFPQLMSVYSQEAPDFATYTLWYEGLFSIDWENTENKYFYENADFLTGQLADSWEVDTENSQIIVYLREDVYFQELDEEYDYYGGRQLVAEDIKWSYDRLLGIGSGFDEPVASMVDWPSLFYMIDSIETDGDFTVIFNCSDLTEIAQNDFVISSTFVHIVGPEYGDLTDEQISDWHYACGTGAFIIDDCVDGQYITFRRNDNYYDYDERYPENKLPYLDSVTLLLVDDSATLLSNFIAGEIDLIGANNGNVFSDSEAAQIASVLDESEYSIYEKYNNTYSIALKQTIEPFQDATVRQAMQYAIDLESICYDLYGYDELTICGYFNTRTGWDLDWDSETELYESYTTYDPELAKEMLEEAGYGDGFEFTLVYDSGLDTAVYEAVQYYLAQVGITMNLQPESESSERQALQKSTTNTVTGVCDLGTNGLSNGLNKIDSTNSNYLFGVEDTLDEMVANLRAQTTTEGRNSAALELNEYFMEQHYALVVSPFIAVNTYASSDVGGYNGENFYYEFIGASMLSRMWNVNGAD